jgi:pimeloyl-ACP methyl ester carboxylesterase
MDSALDMRTPSAPQRHTTWPKQRRSIRRLLLALAALVAFGTAGALYQGLATHWDRQTFPPAGLIVDVHGSPMHLHCLGAGRPTVVLESGNGAPLAIWARIQPELARHARVCAYDRAGLGWSAPSVAGRDARRIAAELHALLASAGEPGPFVLVGHSLGGQYALMFAASYPEETAGLALIDAQHPETLFGIPEATAVYEQQRRQIDLILILSRLGVVRLLGIGAADERLPREAQNQLNAAKNATSTLATLRDEFHAIPVSREQLRAITSLGDLPLVVLSATEHGMPEYEVYTMGLQRELAALSTRTRHLIVTGADHSSLLVDADDSVHAVEAVLELLPLAQQEQRRGT